MRLYDLRLASEKAVVLSFGCTESDNVSRYLRPDWKPDAWIVSSGNMADLKSIYGITIARIMSSFESRMLTIALQGYALQRRC
jgi:hypothetical protein